MKDIPEKITKQIRSFNRFYTGVIGAVNQSVLNSPFSVAEARVLYEIKHKGTPTASEINVELGLDPGYLSRIIRRELRKQGISQVKVVYSREQPLQPQTTDQLGTAGSTSSHPGRNSPGSVAFVPSVAGLIIAGEVIKDLIGK